MPIPQTQTILKSYFETGDIPTQAEFAEMIDTFFALYQSVIDTAEASAALVEATQLDLLKHLAWKDEAPLPTAYVKFNINTSSSGSPIILTRISPTGTDLDFGWGYSEAIKQGTAAAYNSVKLTFSTPFADATYTILHNGSAVRTKTAAYCLIDFAAAGIYYIAVMPALA